MNFGKQLKMLRKHLRMTQAQFAARIGLKQNTIAQYEQNLRVPSDIAIKSICREFHANPDWLIHGEAPMFLIDKKKIIDQKVEEYNGSDMFREMLEIFANLPADAQVAFENFVAMLSQQLAVTRQMAMQKQADTMPEEVQRKLETKDEIIGDAEHKEGMNLDGESDGA